MVQTRTLANIAGYGIVICLGTGFYFHRKVQSQFQETQYYKASMKLLRQHKGAVKILGEPIKDGNLDLGDDYNKVDGLNARLAVPVKGPKERGKLYLFASRTLHTEPYAVDRLELQFEKDDTRRLLVYNKKT